MIAYMKRASNWSSLLLSTRVMRTAMKTACNSTMTLVAEELDFFAGGVAVGVGLALRAEKGLSFLT